MDWADWMEYRTRWTRANGAEYRSGRNIGRGRQGGLADGVDGAEYRTRGNTGQSGLGRTDRIGRRGPEGADGAEYRTRRNTGQSGLGRMGRIGQRGPDGADRVEGGGRSRQGRGGWTGRTGRPGTDVAADWADRLGRGGLGRPASLRLMAEGIRDILSPNADYRVIWFHTLGIHVKFFRAHIIVIFLGIDTSKAQRASPGDKFFGLLGALNITYSMFIQIGHAIHDIVIVTYKGGLSSLVPPLPLCTSCCS